VQALKADRGLISAVRTRRDNGAASRKTSLMTRLTDGLFPLARCDSLSFFPLCRVKRQQVRGSDLGSCLVKNGQRRERNYKRANREIALGLMPSARWHQNMNRARSTPQLEAG
jgi:hypothetical protein